MSEYQYYEFLAIDRPLDAAALAEVRKISRRAQPTPSGVVFDYSYGDYPGDPLNLLEKHYDALVYMANWGSKQLAFRFPRAAIDVAALQRYACSEAIQLILKPQHVLLNIVIEEEDSLGWVEGDGLLAQLAPLRADIMDGDLRAPYLAWLKWAAMGGPIEDEDLDPDRLAEPPLPAGLGQLTAPLQALVEFLDIDQDLVAAAALTSPPFQAVDEPVEQWVARLRQVERDAFLVRAARGDRIGPELLRRLREIGRAGAPPEHVNSAARSFGGIKAGVAAVRAERIGRERRAAEQARLRHLEDVGRSEEQLWQALPGLIGQQTASAYDRATTALADLRALAIHRRDRDRFVQRFEQLQAAVRFTPTLIKRLQKANVLQ
jgi:hypothetical protein